MTTQTLRYCWMLDHLHRRRMRFEQRLCLCRKFDQDDCQSRIGNVFAWSLRTKATWDRRRR